VAAIIGALRWGMVMIGLVFAAQRAAGGELRVAATVAVAIFITSWRTVFPLRLGDPSRSARLEALVDVVLLAGAIGQLDGLGNPLVGTLFVAVAIAGFGWGLPHGALAGALAMAVANAAYFFGGDNFTSPSSVAISALAASAIIPGMVLDRLLEIEGGRRVLVDEHDQLTKANHLLGALNDLALVLPSSLNLPDVVSTARSELIEIFEARRLVLLSFEDGKYAPLVQDGFQLPPSSTMHELPPLLRRAARSPVPMRVQDLSRETEREGSGLYIRLVVDNHDTGLLAVEHHETGRYSERDRELIEGMAEMLALTLDNARSFNQLRSLAADEERSRIARDLHDRLGQYLTYISLELERINSQEESPALKELHGEVQGAIGEFRDTLLELRTAVTAERPLAVVLPEVVERFRKRSAVAVEVAVANRTERLPARVENEFLRIAQEALTNVEKHAMAEKVHIHWTVADGRGVLVVQDDGRGFDPAGGIRGNAYGLVGMRERAASVGGVLDVSSEPGEGTSITVEFSQQPTR
jgi:signal transduction histidine kinase